MGKCLFSFKYIINIIILDYRSVATCLIERHQYFCKAVLAGFLKSYHLASSELDFIISSFFSNFIEARSMDSLTHQVLPQRKQDSEMEGRGRAGSQQESLQS